MRLAVNIDHFATLREARRGAEPEPVLVALLAEQAGRPRHRLPHSRDRRHIKERTCAPEGRRQDQAHVEMAATEEMKRIALRDPS